MAANRVACGTLCALHYKTLFYIASRVALQYRPICKGTLYSAVPNKRAGWNKQAGGTFFWKYNKRAVWNKRAGRIFLKNLVSKQAGINEQVGIF